MNLFKKQIGYIFVVDIKTITDKIQDIFNQIDFNILDMYYNTANQTVRYTGYCPLFDEIYINDNIPTYELIIHMNTKDNSIENIEVKKYDN